MPVFTLPKKDQPQAPRDLAALPIAIPAAATGALLVVSMAAVAGIGLTWNSLSKDEQRIVGDTVKSSFGNMLEGIAKGGDLRKFPKQMADLQRVVMEAMAGNAEVPSLDDVLKAVDSLPVVGECQIKKPEDLIGMCGLCTSQAFQQLRKMGIKSVTQEPVANGAHYVVRIATKQGEYILDCTLGQFGGVNEPDSPWAKANLLKGKGNDNVVLVKKETYLELLKTHTRARNF
jgi:hypothetical protein